MDAEDGVPPGFDESYGLNRHGQPGASARLGVSPYFSGGCLFLETTFFCKIVNCFIGHALRVPFSGHLSLFFGFRAVLWRMID
jgi:hypothetical protein